MTIYFISWLLIYGIGNLSWFALSIKKITMSEFITVWGLVLFTFTL